MKSALNFQFIYTTAIHSKCGTLLKSISNQIIQTTTYTEYSCSKSGKENFPLTERNTWFSVSGHLPEVTGGFNMTENSLKNKRRIEAFRSTLKESKI